MKTKKMENILKFLDKNLKFKYEFRGKRRSSKTIKYKSKYIDVISILSE